MTTKPKIHSVPIKKDAVKKLPIWCANCNGIMEHEIVFKHFDHGSQLITYTKLCSGDIQRAVFKYTQKPLPSVECLDVNEFIALWSYNGW